MSILGATSGFHRDVNYICALPGYYAAQGGNSVLKFRDNPSVPSSRVKKSNVLTLDDVVPVHKSSPCFTIYVNHSCLIRETDCYLMYARCI